MRHISEATLYILVDFPSNPECGLNNPCLECYRCVKGQCIPHEMVPRRKSPGIFRDLPTTPYCSRCSSCRRRALNDGHLLPMASPRFIVMPPSGPECNGFQCPVCHQCSVNHHGQPKCVYMDRCCPDSKKLR